MTATEVLRAIRELVGAAEEDGWDLDDNQHILNRGREAAAALPFLLGIDPSVGDDQS